jgi:hypothetical protein
MAHAESGRRTMADSIGLWAVNDGRLVRVAARPIDRERRLEDWIESNPDILGQRLLLVGRQVQTRYGGIIDLIAVDDEGRCVVIELKRGRTPRDIVAQALDYISWVAELPDSEVRDRIARNSGLSFNEAYQKQYGARNPPEQLNTDQRILIVATDVDEATTRIVQHLTGRYGVDINVVNLSYFSVGEQELLARTWVVDPAELLERVDSRTPDPIAMGADRAWTGLWHVNLGVAPGEGVQRNWEDPRRYGFVSAGHGPKWRDEISRLAIGDRIYAYLNGAGYVGGGEVRSTAERADNFIPPGFDKPLRELPLESQSWFLDGDDPELAEYMVGVKWSGAVEPSEGLRASPAIRGTVRKIWSADLGDRLRAAFG